MPKNFWTYDELILAFNLYLKLPFGKMHSRTPEIIHLAKIIGRTSDSVAIRLTNFAHVDPYHQNRGVKGMSGGKRQVEPIWNEFINDKEKLVFESEKILAERENLTIETKFRDILNDITNLKGETKIREVKTRVNQNFFRQVVVANYSSKCAITGIDIPDLLVASHIIPWSINEDERLNPRNGLCLNSLHDKAFDKGLITVTADFEIKVSSLIHEHAKEEAINQYFIQIQNKKIKIPERFVPAKEFLDYHYQEIFRK